MTDAGSGTQMGHSSVMSTTDTSNTAGTDDASEDLLTLHLDRLDDSDKWNADDIIGVDGDAGKKLEPHWYLGFAADAGIITWDREKWNRPFLGAGFTDATQRVIEFTITYEFPDNNPIATVVVADETDYPDNFNDLTTEEQEALPSTLVPNPPTIANWLTYIVANLNQLHRDTQQLVHAWPRT